MTLAEPSTLITDLLIAGVSAPLAWKLRNKAGAPRQWFSLALAFNALAAVIGGLYHGFAGNFSTLVSNIWWNITLLTISIIAAALAAGLVYEVAANRQRGFWLSLVAIKFVGFAYFALHNRQFLSVMMDYGTSVFAWSIAALVLRRPWSRMILIGTAACIAAAIVQQSRWDLGTNLNHNDLYHLIQIAAVVAFYQAALHMSSNVTAEQGPS